MYTISHPVRKRHGYIYIYIYGSFTTNGGRYRFTSRRKRMASSASKGRFRKIKIEALGVAILLCHSVALLYLLGYRDNFRPLVPRLAIRIDLCLSFYESVPASKLFYGNRCMVEGRVCDIFTCVIIYYRSLLKNVEERNCEDIIS